MLATSQALGPGVIIGAGFRL